MKKTLVTAAILLLSASTFAQDALFDIGNSDDGIMSGEININLPYDPSEAEDPANDFGDEIVIGDDFNLNAAYEVQTGPESMIILLMALALSAGIYTAYTRTQKS